MNRKVFEGVEEILDRIREMVLNTWYFDNETTVVFNRGFRRMFDVLLIHKFFCTWVLHSLGACN